MPKKPTKNPHLRKKSSGGQAKKPVKKPIKKTKKPGYTAANITVLEGLEAVRKRPGMYIGSTGDSGLLHMMREVVDNALDEAMAGFATQITIKLLPDSVVEVTDNGRGIPIDIHKQTKKSALETIMTTLHAGGKFDQDTYKVSGGLHGVGVSVVNALSSWTKAEVYKDGKVWEQEYRQGKAVRKVRSTGKTAQKGTTITFRPDSDIFDTIEWNWEAIVHHFRQQAYLTKGVTISIHDLRKTKNPKLAPAYCFHFEGGVASYVRHLNLNNDHQNETVFHMQKKHAESDSEVEIALQYVKEYQENILCYANNITTPEGGSHLAGFRAALTRTLNTYARKQEILKEKDENLAGEDVREGLTAVISVKLPDPQFEGQTKAKLGNPEIRTAVEALFAEELAVFLEEHPKEASSMLEKCLLASRARKAARAARETVLRKGALEGLMLPGKLADCSTKDASQSEVYIVEGDSAGGSAKQGRDREFQAVLPMWGKMLNVEKARLDKILTSDKLKPLIIALGTNIGELFDLEKLRYGKVIIMADADVDGAHIRTLLLTFFYRHFRPIVDGGHLYIAQPPLYSVQRGKVMRYAHTDEERDKIIKELSKNIKTSKKGNVSNSASVGAQNSVPLQDGENQDTEKISGVNVQRYKGLGEMNPEQLWATTMDPANRIMLRVTAEDAARANETFEILMGSEVAPRKKFIQTHAKAVKNLDI